MKPEINQIHTESLEYPKELPRSSSNIYVNCLSVLIFTAAIYWGQKFTTILGLGNIVFGALVAAVVPLFLRDYLLFGRKWLSPKRTNNQSVQNSWLILLTKLIGLYATFYIILIIYGITPVYWQSPKVIDFYTPFFRIVDESGFLFLILSAVYFWMVDRSHNNPRDEYWQIGRLFLGRFKDCRKTVLVEYIKAWFIKAFFLPFMFCMLVYYVQVITSWEAQGQGFFFIVSHWLDVFYTIDVLFGVLGYFWAFKILNTHIQSTEPTLLGWWACLACYSPVYSILGLGLLPAQSEMSWEVWLALEPSLLYVWGGGIIFLTLIYALATVAFGYRMSNLTYRGIITSGPYRYTKHPAYICKVLSWWMISMPFLSTAGIKGALVQTLSMVAVSVVYFFRARTEENHLSNYPEYVRYAHWINEHGLFAFLGKVFPGIQYSYARAQKSNSVVWFKKENNQGALL